MTSKDTWSRFMDTFVTEGYLAKLSGSAAKVYFVLLQHSDYHFKDVHPGTKRLCKLTGLKSTAVRDAVKELVSHGIIEKVNRSSSVNGTLSNMYSFKKVDIGGIGNPIGGYREDDRGGYRESDIGGIGNPTPNYKALTKEITTTSPPLKRETVIREYETEVPDLEKAVVAILKNLNVDETAWPLAQGISINRIKEWEKKATKPHVEDQGSYFAQLMRKQDEWKPKKDKDADFTCFCDRFKRSFSHVKSKVTGKTYPIINRTKSSPHIAVAVATGNEESYSETFSDEDEFVGMFTGWNE